MEEKTELERLQEENELLRSKLDLILLKQEKKKERRTWIGKRLTGAWAGSKLRNSFLALYKEIPEKKVSRETLADFSASLAWRISRIGLFMMLAALLPAAILIIQTFMLNKQNKLLEKQNFRLDQQTNLVEAERRGSLVFVMSSLMDEMTEERRMYGGDISDGLSARIISLTQALRPYRFLENDVLTEQPLSPEKGQLFINLLESNISTNSKDIILEKGNFSNTDLMGANIRLVNTQKFQFQGSRVSNAKIFNCNFSNLEGDALDFENSWLEANTFDKSTLMNASFRNASVFNSSFKASDLSNTNFTNALLFNVDFSKSNLSQSILNNAVVESNDWFNNLSKRGVKGVEALEKKYKIVALKDLENYSANIRARLSAYHGNKPLFQLVEK